MDGNFRNGHILYDPDIFDGHLVTEIESICPRPFPWQTTDITRPSEPRNPNESTDRILQLIFFNPETLAEEIVHSEEYFTYYRMFVFSSPNEIDAEEPVTVIKGQNINFGSTNFVLHHNTETELIYIHGLPNTADASVELEKLMRPDPKAIALPNSKFNVDNVNLFDRTFGKHDQLQSIMIRVGGYFHVSPSYRGTDFKAHPSRLYFTNYYLRTLNTPYIKVSYVNVENQKEPTKDEIITVNQRKYYKELSNDFQQFVEDENSWVLFNFFRKYLELLIKH